MRGRTSGPFGLPVSSFLRGQCRGPLMTTLRPTAAIALPVAALLVMATPLAWGFAAAAAPSAAAPAPPAEQKKIPPASGPEQAAQAPQAPKAIPVPELGKRADEVAKRLRETEELTAPRPAIDAIQARLPEVRDRKSVV